MIYSSNYKKREQERGFTLLELLVALAVGSVMMGLIATTYSRMTGSNRSQQALVQMQQNARAGLFVMEQEIKMAGYKPSPASLGNARIEAATSSSLTFSIVDPTLDQDNIDNDGDGTVDETGEKDNVDNDGDGTKDEDGELETIRYQLFDSLSDGDQDLGRSLWENNAGVLTWRRTDAIAENIALLEFFYTMKNGVQALNPTNAQLTEIRAVTVALLAQSEKPEGGNFRQANVSYTTPAGTTWSAANGDFDGKYRHQLLTTTIMCRNLYGR